MNGAGLGIMRIVFQDLQVMLAGPRWLMELLGVEIPQGQMRPGFIGIPSEDLLQFIRGVGQQEQIGSCSLRSLRPIVPCAPRWPR